MKLNAGITCFCIALLVVSGAACADGTSHPVSSVLDLTNAWDTVVGDYKEFYSLHRLERMGIAFTAGGIIANTHTDAMFQKWYQTDVHSSTTDDIASINKNFGESKYVLPATVAAVVLDNVIQGTAYNSTVGRWSKRTLRSFLLGAPLLWAAQNLTGAYRPAMHRNSHWHPFRDSHGVSGHAFVGAVPFMVMAGMADQNIWLKSFFYAASTAAGISRINDNAHYLSQVLLGWYLAWETTDTVHDRETREKNYAVAPMMLKDGYGINVSMRW